MPLQTRTKLATLIRQYNFGIIDAHEFYHAVCAALSEE